jgi:hypothetical protein
MKRQEPLAAWVNGVLQKECENRTPASRRPSIVRNIQDMLQTAQEDRHYVILDPRTDIEAPKSRKAVDEKWTWATAQVESFEEDVRSLCDGSLKEIYWND